MTLLAHNEYHSLIMLWHTELEAVSITLSYQPSSIRNVLFLQMVNSASEVTEGCILEVSNLSLLSFSCVSLKHSLSPSLSPISLYPLVSCICIYLSTPVSFLDYSHIRSFSTPLPLGTRMWRFGPTASPFIHTRLQPSATSVGRCSLECSNRSGCQLKVQNHNTPLQRAWNANTAAWTSTSAASSRSRMTARRRRREFWGQTAATALGRAPPYSALTAVSHYCLLREGAEGNIVTWRV